MKQPSTYQTTYRTLHASEPPNRVSWQTSKADILSPGRGFMAAFDYTMQIQVGCPGGCLFCYVPTKARLTPTKVRGHNGQSWGFVVRDKEAVVAKFQRHLEQGDLADKTLYWSGVTDPYAASPTSTQALWQTLLQTPPRLRPRRIALQTRFRPDRDSSLMQKYQESTTSSDQGPALVVSYSIGSDRNDLIAAWERATPPVEQRLQAIKTLREHGIFVVATLSPLGFWNDLAGTLTQFREWGVAYLTCLVFKEKGASATTPARFLTYLHQYHPCLLDPTWQSEQIEQMQAVYGVERVLIGKAGFDSLSQPQTVGQES